MENLDLSYKALVNVERLNQSKIGMSRCLYMLALYPNNKSQKGLFIWSEILHVCLALVKKQQQQIERVGNQIWPNTLKLLKHVWPYILLRPMEIVTFGCCVIFQFTRGGLSTGEQHSTSYFTQEEAG